MKFDAVNAILGTFVCALFGGGGGLFVGYALDVALRANWPGMPAIVLGAIAGAIYGVYAVACDARTARARRTCYGRPLADSLDTERVIVGRYFA
jgi:hypothetical protein